VGEKIYGCAETPCTVVRSRSLMETSGATAAAGKVSRTGERRQAALWRSLVHSRPTVVLGGKIRGNVCVAVGVVLAPHTAGSVSGRRPGQWTPGCLRRRTRTNIDEGTVG